MDEPDLSCIQYHYQTAIYQYHQYQGKTNNCGPTSLAISINAINHNSTFKGENIADELDHWTKHFPRLIIPRIASWATFPWGLVQYLRYQKIPGKWFLGGSLEKLIENINREIITMVIIGEPLRSKNWEYEGWSHIKVLYGYSPGHLYFIDPAYKKGAGVKNEISNSGIFKQAEEDFLKKWKNMLKMYIELG